MTAWLVETEWLQEHLSAPDIVVLDASWHLPTENRNPKAEFLEAHIPGAMFFDIDEISDTDSDLPHMLPSPEKFASRMRRMGVGDGSRVVVYDTRGLMSAARVWWMFRVMGHEDVAVLNGGLPKWTAENRPTEDGGARPRQEKHFTARLQTMMVRDKHDVSKASENGNALIVDARSAGRFQGTSPEPREGLRSGHIPNSINLPFDRLLADDKTLKTSEELSAVFESAGITPGKPVITTCGSGVTAAILSLGLAIAGNAKTGLYDGSWTEWGGDHSLPVGQAD